jgi:hypothetical protein
VVLFRLDSKELTPYVRHGATSLIEYLPMRHFGEKGACAHAGSSRAEGTFGEMPVLWSRFCEGYQA